MFVAAANAEWRFEESLAGKTSGTDAIDVIGSLALPMGSGNNRAVFSQTTNNTGLENTAVLLTQGSTVANYWKISCTSVPASLYPTEALSLEITVKFTTPGAQTDDVTLVRRHTNSKGYHLYVKADNTLAFRINSTTLSTTHAITSGWHHYVATYDKQMMRVYVDGVQVGSTSLTASIGSMTETTGCDFKAAGESTSAGAKNLNGSVDDLLVYGYALSAEQVQGRANAFSAQASSGSSSSSVATSSVASSQSSSASTSSASTSSVSTSSSSSSSSVSSSLVSFDGPASACTTTVTNSSTWTTAMSSVKAGDTVCVSGSYSSGLKITGKTGTSNAPIVIRATNPLGTTLPSFEINTSSYVVVRDFVFKAATGSTLFKIVASQNTALLRNDFDFTGPGSTAIAQTGLVTTTDSNDIEVAFNNFHDHLFPGNDGQTLISGSFIKTQVDTINGVPTISKRMWIHHNQFKNMAPHVSAGQTTPDGDSDREAIVFGTSASSQLETSHLVEHNLFDNCDGENEIITIKTSVNVIRYNTFKNSFGSVSVRFGHDTEVYGNYFYGEGASSVYTDPNYQTGGIRVYGTHHKVYNNYLEGLTGTTWRLPIFVDSGDTDSTTGNSHQRPQFIEVSHNTLVNNVGALTIGNPGFQSSYNRKPLNSKVANNIVTASSGSLMDDYGDASNSFEGNIAYGTGSAVLGASKAADEIWSVDPMLQNTSSNGYSLKRLGSASPAINASRGSYSYVTRDMDGESRSGIADVGADEYSDSPVITLKPLMPADVGPGAPR